MPEKKSENESKAPEVKPLEASIGVAEEAVEVAPEPVKNEKNVIFVGPGDAPEAIFGVKRFLDLPSSEEQKEGFYYERATELIRASRFHKRFVKKGEK